MKPKTEKLEPDLLLFSQPINMKFRPKQEEITIPKTQQSLSPRFLKRLGDMLPWRNKSNSQLSPQPTNNSSESSNLVHYGSNIKENSKENKKLEFLANLSSNAVLIGNKNQLDAIGFGRINEEGFVETEHLWSLNLKGGFELVITDHKKTETIIVAGKNELLIYKYNVKNLHSKPQLPMTINLSATPKFIFVARQYVICFFQTKLQVFSITEARKKFQKNYSQFKAFRESNLKLLTVPHHKDNLFHIFFMEDKDQESNIFTLWASEFQVFNADVKLNTINKVYEINKNLKNRMKLYTYSKDIFIMNLGSQILAISKGYILDSVRVNLTAQSSKFIYFPDGTLIHLSKKFVEIYQLTIDQSTKPYRIVTKSKDSLAFFQSQENAIFEKYFSTIQIANNTGFVMIFAEKPEENMKLKGQLQYSMYLTRPISRKNKLNQIFPLKNAGQHLNEVQLFEKCTMAQKMGLTEKQIYLQLWKRSNKKSDEDFKLLLCTKDYKTIKQEVSIKLKKHSMKLKQILKIEENCFNMLSDAIFHEKCKSEQKIMQYLKCHFFKRKLEYHKDLCLINKLEQKQGKEPIAIHITIQEYYEYEILDIKTQLLKYIQNFCETKKKSWIKKIRLIILHFRFAFRFIYSDLLKQIVQVCKENLIFLLRQMPQLLPYTYPFDEEPSDYCYGVYNEIDKRQWKNSLYNSVIYTIDTKQLYFEKIVKALQFRRNFLTLHDTITQSKEKIIANFELIKSQKIFVSFIAKFLLEVKDKDRLQQIISFVTQKYDQIPTYLKDSIFFYFKVYKFLQGRNLLPLIDQKPCSLSEFLQFRAHKIFKHFFELERSQKNLILKKIKPQCFEEVEGGTEKFSQGLLNYFTSDLSEVSDLKYILNRINNEKIEFHEKNQELYEVLVEALKRKMKVGTQNDIPLSQVLIYIDNIPLIPKTESGDVHPAFAELKIIAKIEEKKEILQKAKVDMSLYDILNSQQQLLTKIIAYEIQEKKLLSLKGQQNYKKFEEMSFKIIISLELLSEQIYQEINKQTIFFLFLIKLCEDKYIIEHVQKLLSNENLSDFYDADTAEHVVQYMYKWKVCSVKVYRKCQSYVQELLKLLPEQHDIGVYIKSQLELGVMLSNANFSQEYPLSKTVINIYDFEEATSPLSSSFMLELDVDLIYYHMNTMQKIVVRHVQQETQQPFNFHYTTKHQILRSIIIKFLKDNRLRQSINYIKTLFSLQAQDKSFNILYPILLMIELSTELNEQNIGCLLECLCRYFNQPEVFLDILQNLILNPLTVIQRKDFLLEAQKTSKDKGIGFNLQNELFNRKLLAVLKEKNLSETFLPILLKTLKHLQYTKQQFKKIKYAAAFIILINDPYLLAEFLNLNFYVNMKCMRSFLSYAIQQEIFNPLNILQIGRRIFLLVCHSRHQSKPIENIMSHYINTSLYEDIQLEFHIQKNKQETFEIKLWKSAEILRKKREFLKKSKRNMKEIQENSHRFLQTLTNMPSSEQKIASQYIFSDSDNEYGNQDMFETIKYKKDGVEFEQKSEKVKFIEKIKQTSSQNNKNLYYSSQVSAKKTSLKPTFSIQKSRQPKKIDVDRQQSFHFQMNEMKPNALQVDQNKQVEKNSMSEYEININTIDEKSEFDKKQMLNNIYKKLIQENLENLQNGMHDFDLSVLDGTSQDSPSLLKIIQKLYESQLPQDVSRQQVIHLISAICESFTVRIEHYVLGIYKKAYQLQKKLSLDLPISQIFTFKALKQETDYEGLYTAISPNIIPLLDDDNIFKIAKAISLIFGQPSYEQQIVFNFLVAKFASKPKARGPQLNQFYQKAQGLIEKLSPQLIIKRMNELFEQLSSLADKEKLKKILTNSVEKNVGPLKKKEFHEKLKELGKKTMI